MTQSEFIKKMLGVKWTNRASSFNAVDCFGLVMLYYKHVLDIKLPLVDGFSEKDDFINCFNAAKDKWQVIDRPTENGILFTCYKGEVPVHVGLCIGHWKVLHCRGSEQQHGKVEIHAIRAVERLYGKITYHKFLG